MEIKKNHEGRFFLTTLIYFYCFYYFLYPDKKINTEQIQKERDEVLSADCEQVREAAKMVSVVLHDGYICAIGSEGKVEDAKELFNEIRVLN